MISSRMQKRLVKLAEKLVNKCTKGTAKGVACRWLNITESWGAKFTAIGFDYMRQVFQNQRRGWRLGLGPFCFGMFKITDNEGDVFYGYITQIAILGSKYLSSKYGNGWYLKTELIFGKRIKKLKKIISDKLQIKANDLHEDNWGFINGKIVVTDWGFDG